jgi:protein phosphatase
MRIVASALSDRGLKRGGSEDQYLIDESLGLYVVCEGIGGHATEGFAAGRAIEFALESISANSEVLESAAERPDRFFRFVGDDTGRVA